MKKAAWERKPIIELCAQHVDCVNRTAPVVSEPTPFKMIRTTNVRNGFIDTENVRYVTEPVYKKWTRRLVPKRGDVILTREAPLGGVGKLRTDDLIFLGQRLYHFRPDPQKLDADFLLYALMADDLQGQIRGFGSGSTVEHMRLADIPNLEIYAPDVFVQRRIAGVLSAYDELIENNTRRIKLLEQMAQALYREWFVRPCHSGNLPKGWEEKQIGEVVETLGGGTPSTKTPEFWDGGDVIWFTPSDLTAAGTMFITDSGKKITRTGLDGSSAKLFPAYSVMMTSRATIGVVAINTKEACTNQGFITCIPNDRVSAYQLYFWIEENKDKIISIASGATYKEISRSEFRELPITVPPVETAKQFVQMVQPVGKLIENLQSKNANLRRTRDLLLPKLISGEVNIS